MGYCDRWTVAPGDPVRFMVSCLDTERYDVAIVRLEQPEVGPLGTPFAPKPVMAPCNGPHTGRRQAIPIGSLAVVPGHPALTPRVGITLATYLFATTPAKGRQALMGTWCEATQTGYGLEIDADGALAFRIGTGPGQVAVVSSGVTLRRRRWYRVGGSFDAATRTAQVWQEPVEAHDFDPQGPVTRRFAVGVAAPSAPAPLTFAAWSTGATAGPSAWGGLGFACHLNGRLDRPRLVAGALDRASILRLLEEPQDPELADRLIGAWDFSADIPGETINDLGPWQLDGMTVNLPTRAMRGANWTGAVMDWTQAPEQYGAIHFHDDDLVDACWEPDFEYTVPADLRSGIYAAKLTADGCTFWVSFFVRPPPGQARSPVAFIASTATYTAYLNYRGRYLSLIGERYSGRLLVMDEIDSLLVEFPELGLATYDRHSAGSGVSYASRLRPLTNLRPTGRHWNFNIDLMIIDWLEKLGGDYDVITDDDIARDGLAALAPYQVVLTGSHPEYDSTGMLDAFEAYLRRGGRLMYLGGNGFYWRIAHHPTREGVIEVRRAEGGVRSWDAEPGEAHMSFSGEYGGGWWGR